ncbi:hypothetical protein [Pseudomonas canadensis]|uniref:hypothetical protein n=1 Tax=Pseudomonas canadensis TaxID=915099 RepID=UPI003BA03535
MEFLLWCETTTPKVDWRQATYLDDLLDRWQVGMLQGIAARSREKLSSGTVNSRVSEACYFLTWAAERGYRSEFLMLRKSIGSNQIFQRNKDRRTESRRCRVGELPDIRRSMSLPPFEALKRWHNALRIRHGQVIALFAETLIRTGMRISEGNGLRTTDFPEKKYGPNGDTWREDWIGMGEIPCIISVGVKGPKVARGSSESNKPRVIYIPLDLADRLEHYRKEGRNTLFSRWISAATTPEERERRRKLTKPTNFWIGKRGKPFTNSWIRQAWGSIDLSPWDWSPHMARHEFAVSTLVQYTRGVVEQAKFPTLPNVGWLHGLMAGQIQIILSPLLGHVSEETTLIYLSAARERLMKEFSHPALLWLQECES